MRRFGTIVMAGSPAKTRKKSEFGHDWKTREAGATLPWSISPMPCSTPANAAIEASAATFVVLALFTSTPPSPLPDAASLQPPPPPGG